jgi:hypothetical protein
MLAAGGSRKIVEVLESARTLLAPTKPSALTASVAGYASSITKMPFVAVRALVPSSLTDAPKIGSPSKLATNPMIWLPPRETGGSFTRDSLSGLV